jgi:hypothetical protein
LFIAHLQGPRKAYEHWLSISKSIIELPGGENQFDSTPNLGSSF